MTKTQAAAEAKAQDLKTFTATCRKHGEQPHYGSTAKCVVCTADMHTKRTETPEGREKHRAAGRATAAKRLANPEARKAHNVRNRTWSANRKASDPAYAANSRAKLVNTNAMERMRKYGRPESAMPSVVAQAECVEFVKHAPAGCQLDHAVPLKGVNPVTGEWVVSGLHVPYNLQPMVMRSNLRKSHWFDPMDPLEFQKPYNSFPGGQFHGDIGDVELLRYVQPTTLELWTKEEFRAALIEAGSAAMEEITNL